MKWWRLRAHCQHQEVFEWFAEYSEPTAIMKSKLWRFEYHFELVSTHNPTYTQGIILTTMRTENPLRTHKILKLTPEMNFKLLYSSHWQQSYDCLIGTTRSKDWILHKEWTSTGVNLEWVPSTENPLVTQGVNFWMNAADCWHPLVTQVLNLECYWVLRTHC